MNRTILLCISGLCVVLASACATTSAASSAPACPANLAEDEVTLDKLTGLFTAAMFSVTTVEDGIRVEDSGVKTLVRLIPDKKLIAFVQLYDFKEGTPTEARVELANRLNVEVVFARFCITADGLLYADYQLCYESGLLTYQVVRSYKWLFATVTGGITNYDSNGIVL